MLCKVESYALVGREHCFWVLGVLLLGARSIAFGLWEQCFWALGAMLLAPWSYAFGIREKRKQPRPVFGSRLLGGYSEWFGMW